MTKLQVKVMSGKHDGTGDNLAMRFTNGRGQHCITSTEYYLSDAEDFDRGRHVYFDTKNNKDKKALGSCARGKFRPDDRLYVEILVNTWGTNFHYDGYGFRNYSRKYIFLKVI